MTTHANRLLFATVAVIAALAVGIYLLVFEGQKAHVDACSGVTRVASDVQKMKYLKSWIASRTSDQEFMSKIGKIRSFESGDPRLREYIDLDWQYLGFTPDYASVAFNVADVGSQAFEASDIDSVSIGLNRSLILVRMSEREDFGLTWPEEALARIQPVAEDVFVYCGR